MIGRAILLAGGLSLASVCAAQKFPEHAVRLIVPYGAGASSDPAIRAFLASMEQKLGQTVIFENRPGAGAMIGSTFVARAPADGYTLLWIFPAAVSKTFVKDPPFDAQKDFTPLSGFCTSAHVLAINADVPAKTLAEFTAYAKKNPGRLNYAQSASTTLLAMELFKSLAGLDIVNVQYKGTAEATTALISGEVQALFGLIISFKQHVASGKLRILASTYPERAPAAADVPTFSELGYPGMKLTITTVFAARSDVPAERLATLAGAMPVDLPEVEKTCVAAGGAAATQRGAALRKLVDSELEQWGNAAVSAKFQPPQ
jgi:tripartite-type tricarboxylate transporter receptor subunit TctC